MANKRQAGDKAEYDEKEAAQRGMNPVPDPADVLFLEIDVVDPSEFSGALCVRGVQIDGHRVLTSGVLIAWWGSRRECGRTRWTCASGWLPRLMVG
ncbi:hypothetical protein ACU610_00165 [Geodermatophilus sp. URMC 61]|uniref:hypothetical protein n=1 Tax=Geodermatophilus sp. URMC 61 TaxID=3423411 RepID=UPI00406CFE42